MSNKRQTAVEWLISEVNKYLAWNVEGEPKAKPYTNEDLVQAMEQAKEMDRQQKMDAFMEGDSFEGRASKKDFEQYYTEIFNNLK
jgi:hypothetical protein